MKIYPILLVLVALGWAAIGQETPTPSRSVFKISPQHFTQNQLKIGLERFNRSYSRSFSFFLMGVYDRYENGNYTQGYNGLGTELQYRKYIVPMTAHTTKKDHVYHRGIYFSGYLQGGYYSGKQSGIATSYDPATGASVTSPYEYTDNIKNFGGGITFGFQQTLWSKLFIEAYVGGGLQFSGHSSSGTLPHDPYYYYYYDSHSVTSLDYQGVLPKIGVRLGIGL
jgi:hypothetical protein